MKRQPRTRKPNKPLPPARDYGTEYESLLEQGLCLAAEIRDLIQREKQYLADTPALQGKLDAIGLAERTGGPAPPGTRWSKPYQISDPFSGEPLGEDRHLEIYENYFTPAEKRNKTEVENLRTQIEAMKQKLSETKAAIDQVRLRANKARVQLPRDRRELFLDPQVYGTTAQHGPRRKKVLTPLKEIVRDAISHGYKGDGFAAFLEEKHAEPRPAWKNDPLWPGSYTVAYKSPKWRERIQDMKCKERILMEKERRPMESK